MATGGSILSVTVAGREFPAVADGSTNRKLGGFSTESKANGDGSTRNIKTRMPWAVSVEVQIDDENKDQQFLQDIQDAGADVDIAIEYLDGVYNAVGLPQGELEADTQEAKMTLELAGPGKLQKSG